MATEPQRSETMPGVASSSELVAQAPAPSDVGADAALIVAALGRLEGAVREERAVLARLRGALGDMSHAIGRAKAVADSETAATLLDEFEHRVDAMIEIAGGPQETAPPTAEPDHVPTVSGVVSRLGPAADHPPEPAAAPAPAANPAEPATSVAMLTAMVEALRDSISAAAPEPAAESAESLEPTTALATVAEQPVADAPPAMESPPVEEAATPPSPPVEALLHETTLLASFEQMGSRPIPPPDEGTAVIFTRRSEPEFVPAAAPEPALEPVPVPQEPEPAPIAETLPEPNPPIETAPAAALEAVEAAVVDPIATVETAAEIAPLAEPSAAAEAATDTEFDPADFLFGPEPEPDPAAFLLDPAPPAPRSEAMLPETEFVAVTPIRAAQMAAPEPVRPTPPLPSSTLHDPLHALKAMTENERIALFS